eukprot:gnl/Spiro4/8074_TR4251_c0_g1_i1.p1 gnl/Spiro4/8074_TR4251_c0_g1~~gnl/Spiro4/8074_TR4251_c0_g1_i1.p1  ORF type:complete len:256 (+),score=7.30 gnl/Spiro4/8074_TR4251_c0_g1_i1:298-1065(+)
MPSLTKKMLSTRLRAVFAPGPDCSIGRLFFRISHAPGHVMCKACLPPPDQPLPDFSGTVRGQVSYANRADGGSASTGAMINHWKNVHGVQAPLEFLELVAAVPEEVTGATAKELDDAVLFHLVHDMLPMSAVEKKGFRKMIGTGFPTWYELPHRTKMTKLLEEKDKQVFESRLEDLHNDLAKCPGLQLHTTIDAWTASNKAKEFFNINVMWLDEQFNHKKLTLDMKYFKGNHTAAKAKQASRKSLSPPRKIGCRE